MLLRPTRTTTIVAAALAAAALGAGGTALAATAGDDAQPTTVAVSPAPTITAGTIAAFDAPGVKAIRRGKAIPAGYVLVGYRIQIHRGTKMAGAALRFACPDGKRLRSFGLIGHAGFAAEREYVGHKVTWIMSTPGMNTPEGRLTDADGTLYAICK